MSGFLFIPGITGADLPTKATVDAALPNAIYWPLATTVACGITGPGLRFQLSAGVAISPMPWALIGGGDVGLFYDPSVIGSLFQDSAGATPVTTIGQPVGRATDRTGAARNAVQATAAARPTYARMPVGGRRNRLPNSGVAGAVVGVLSAGGSLPTGWSTVGIPTTAIEVLSLAPKNGRPNVKIRFNGTPTTSIQLFVNGSTDVPALAAETWMSSVYVQRTAGSNTNLTAIGIATTARDVSGGFVNLANLADITSTVADDVRGLSLATLVGGTVRFIRNSVQLSWTAGAIDITLDLSAPQVEQAAAATVFQTVNGEADITEVDKANRFALLDDLVDDTLAATLPAGTYTIASGDDAGVTILTGQVLGAGAYTIPGPRRLFAGVAIDCALNGTETAALTAWINARRP